MYKIPLPELKEKIIQSGTITAAELETRIKAKINELSGLISEEGAAHIIANELGIELIPQGKEQFKIKELYAGMRGVSTAGKVLRIFEVREFAKADRTGRVCSLLLGDETDSIRIVFWNDLVDTITSIQEKDILLLKDIVVRDNKGTKEVHVGDRTEITVNPAGVIIGAVRNTASFERKKVEELQDGQERVELLGTIVQIFDPRFFDVCPECNKKVQESETGKQCVTHGAVQPSLAYVLNAVLDDGTGTIRGVFWKNQVHHLLGKSEKEIQSYREDASLFQPLKDELYGEQLKVSGRVKRNELFDRLEFSVQTVERASPEEELARLEKSR